MTTAMCDVPLGCGAGRLTCASGELAELPAMHVHGSVTTRLLGPQLWVTIGWQGALHLL